MTDDTKHTQTLSEHLKDLSEKAMPGDWVARPWGDGDNYPGEVNIFDDASRVCIAEDVRQEEAELICALVNAYRSGQLVVNEDAARLCERLFRRGVNPEKWPDYFRSRNIDAYAETNAPKETNDDQ